MILMMQNNKEATGMPFMSNEDGSVERFKARLVAKGCTKKEGTDDTETFASVAKMVTDRTFLVTGVPHNWHIAQMDINNAFLHEKVYMALPQGYTHNSTIQNPVCKLQKSLYGLKQANRQWFTKLTEFLLQNGFTQSYVGTSLLTNKKDKDFMALLHEAFSIKDLGSLNYYLVDPLAKLNETDGDLFVDPSQYRAFSKNTTSKGSNQSSQLHKVLYLRPIVIVIGQAIKQQEDPQLASASFLAHALFPGNQEANYLQIFTSTLVPILCDNQSSIALAANPVQHARTKHIEIDCHFVREKIKAGILGWQMSSQKV
ncbi:retrovirus-related pol polyprotein from transposon TNT 1-94 [Tanacetum coccineum]